MKPFIRVTACAILLTLLLGSVSLAQHPAAVLTAVANPPQIDVGQETAVEVWVSAIYDLYAAQFTMGFDGTVLQALSIEPGTAFTAFPNEYEVALSEIGSDSVRFAATLLRVPKAGPLSGDLHLATVRFRGLAEGTSPLTWQEVKLANQQGQTIAVSMAPGQVIVGGQPTPDVGTLLKGVAVDPRQSRVYVSAQSNNTVALMDAATHAWIGAVPSGGDHPNGLALSADGTKLFVANSGSNQVAVLNPNDSYAVQARIDVGPNPFGVAIANGVAYVTNFDGTSVTLIDVASMAVLRTVDVGHHPALPAATGNRAYIPLHSAYTRWSARDGADEWAYVQSRLKQDTGVAIVHADGQVERVLSEYIGFFAAAVDETHGRVYITKRDGTAEGLYVLDAADNRLLQFVPMLRPYAVAVNPQTQHVFVVQADLDEIYVLDGTNGCRLVRVVNTDPNNGDWPDMHGGQGIAMLGSTVYASNFSAGTVAAIDDSGAGGTWTVPMDVDYIRGWMESGGNHGPLGAPTAPGRSYVYTAQEFERGMMHWRPAPSGPGTIYVFDIESPLTGGTDWNSRDDGVWQGYDDPWHDGLPVLPAACPDAWWPYGPTFGFGLVWCAEPGVKAAIGYPIGTTTADSGGEQVFQNGIVLWNPASDAYLVLRIDNQRWQYYRAHRRYILEGFEPNVTGQVTLQGRTGGLEGTVLQIEGGPALVTDAEGRFGLHARETLRLTVRHRGYLAAQVTVDAAPGVPLDLGAIALLGGDVNDDGRIDILDLAYVGHRFGGADPDADLNADGRVDILDLALLGSNFGR